MKHTISTIIQKSQKIFDKELFFFDKDLQKKFPESKLEIIEYKIK